MKKNISSFFSLVLVLFIFPGDLWAKGRKPPTPSLMLKKSIEQMGTSKKFDRLETLSYQFEEMFILYAEDDPSQKEVKKGRGRHLFRFLSKDQFWMREDLETPYGSQITVLGPDYVRVWNKNGEVLNGDILRSQKARLQSALLFALAPFSFASHQLTPENQGEETFGGVKYHKLRLKNDSGHRILFPSPYIDTFLSMDTYKMIGVSYVAKSDQKKVWVHFSKSHDIMGLTLPIERVEYNTDFRPTRRFQIADVAFNRFLHESFFQKKEPELLESDFSLNLNY